MKVRIKKRLVGKNGIWEKRCRECGMVNFSFERGPYFINEKCFMGEIYMSNDCNCIE